MMNATVSGPGGLEEELESAVDEDLSESLMGRKAATAKGVKQG